MDLGLKDRKAIITGGSRGLGRAAAETLAAEGCDIAICSRGADGVEEAKKSLEAKGVNVFAQAVDVGDKDGDTVGSAVVGEFVGDTVGPEVVGGIVGDTVVRPLKLPQGLHTSGAGAILNAAWQRDRKFRCPQIPPTVRSLMRIFACIYVDDACITMPYVSGDADTEAAADAALAELSSTDGPFTHLPLYAPPIAITTEPGTKFLETDILVMMGGSQLAAAHRNPDVGRMLATYAAQNHRIVPARTRVSADAQLSYVLGMLSRVEQNCTYLLHTASAVLEMVVELRLHGWSPMVVTKALRSRLDAAGDGDGRAAYLLVLDVLRECNNQALHPEREQPSVRPAIGTARAMVLSRAAAGR